MTPAPQISPPGLQPRWIRGPNSGVLAWRRGKLTVPPWTRRLSPSQGSWRKRRPSPRSSCKLVRRTATSKRVFGQLEGRLDTEIEQLNDELAGLEEAGSSMSSVESRIFDDDQRAPKPSGCGIRETRGVLTRRRQEAQPIYQHALRSVGPRQYAMCGQGRDGPVGVLLPLLCVSSVRSSSSYAPVHELLRAASRGPASSHLGRRSSMGSRGFSAYPTTLDARSRTVCTLVLLSLPVR